MITALFFGEFADSAAIGNVLSHPSKVVLFLLKYLFGRKKAMGRNPCSSKQICGPCNRRQEVPGLVRTSLMA